MELDKEEIKPLIEALGSAVLDSQRLEYSLAFMMLLLNNQINLSDKQQDEQIDNYMESLSKKTLGSLISELKKLTSVSDGIQEQLASALDARNYVIHKFFNDQSEKLLTFEGRSEALKILKVKRKIIFKCYSSLDPFIQGLMRLKGIDPDSIIDDISDKIETIAKLKNS